ncbi:MAG: protein translocase subunit SecD [Chloroflexota bacterium]|nr:protein translocase subunit SecD [Chloroflexota bacterium]
MNRGNIIRLVIIVALLAISLSALLVKEYHIPLLGDRGYGDNPMGMSLGLDLSGGTHLVYKADLSQIGNETAVDAVQGVMEIISRRVDAYGVSEPSIQKMGSDRISVQLPGIRDMDAAVNLIGSTAQLDFREVLLDNQGDPAIGESAFILWDLPLTQEEKNELEQALISLSGNSSITGFVEIATFGGSTALPVLVFDSEITQESLEQELDGLGYATTNIQMITRAPYWDTELYSIPEDPRLWVPALATSSDGKQLALTGKYLKRNAHVVIRQDTNEPQVAFELDDEGAELFAEITGRLFAGTNSPDNKPLGIFLDDHLVSSPTVQAVLSDSGVITGLSLDRAQELSILLNAGALPVSLMGPIIREDIDPTLGGDSINRSLIAGMVGLLMILVFMMLYYRLPGVLASVALLFYGILVLAAFKLIPVTLTLAGLAAFVLSIGMAVDANVLIFERLKEELRGGRTLGGAIEAGFNRAWTAIRDSNISTLITCGILYWMGSTLAIPSVMGFALTLAIGVLLSMFTAIFVTRTLLRLFIGTNLAQRLPLFGVGKLEQTSFPKEHV